MASINSIALKTAKTPRVLAILMAIGLSNNSGIICLMINNAQFQIRKDSELQIRGSTEHNSKTVSLNFSTKTYVVTPH